MKERLKTLFVTAGLTRAEYFQMMDDNIDEDAHTVRISCLGYITYFSVLAVVWGFHDDGFGFVLHDIALILSYLALFLFHKPKKGLHNTIAFETIVGLGIIYGLFAAYYSHLNGENSFALVGCMMIIILTCPFRPIMGSITLLTGVTLFVLEIVITKPDMSVWPDLVNTISFGTVSCYIQSEVNAIRVRAYLAKKKYRDEAHMDSLTGTKNRMDFSLTLEQYQNEKTNLPTCIYIDVNGLHNLNNRCGHAAGDALIKTVAQKISDLFGVEHTYRIGGDEFVVITSISDEKHIKDKLETMRSDLDKQNYSVSVGYVLPGNADSIEKLIQDAETAMYADKSDYYRRNHIERRTQR